jgi:hypothetical protein
VLRQEGEGEAGDEEPEVELREPLVVHSTGDLREPVVRAREDPEDGAAEEDVVEVRDDVVAVLGLVVEWIDGDHDP